jgi:hypothetical protein
LTSKILPLSTGGVTWVIYISPHLLSSENLSKYTTIKANSN